MKESGWKMVWRGLFRFRVRGMDRPPLASGKTSGRLILANHPSPWDGWLLAPFLEEDLLVILPAGENPPRRLAWLMPRVRFFSWDANDPEVEMMVVRELDRGRTVLVFPESLTPTSAMFQKIPTHVMALINREGISLWILYLDGPQHLFNAPGWPGIQRHGFPRMEAILIPARPSMVQPEGGGGKWQPWQLQNLLGMAVLASSKAEGTLWHALCVAAARHGLGRKIAEDENTSPLSYRGLLFKSAILGRLLLEQTASQERVGVMLPTIVPTLAVFFALQAIGRVPCMLNFSAGAQAVTSACHTAQVKTILTSRGFILKARLKPLLTILEADESVRVLFLEDFKSRLGPVAFIRAWLATLWPQRAFRAYQRPSGDPAVLLFTSGSEDNPKGVVLSHRNMLANIQQYLVRLDFHGRDLLLNVLPMFHAFGLTAAALTPLFVGMRAFYYPSVLDYRAIPQWSYRLQATILAGTDTFLSGYGRMADAVDFHSLRYCFAGAEPLREATRDLWQEKFGIRILEGYGATETSPVLAFNTPGSCRMGSVGRILPGLEYHWQSVPGLAQGAILWVKGPNVMMGYLRAEAPGVLQPPTTTLGEGWYDTGDAARMDEEGHLWILGRLRRFAKIGGEMVSLAAVEALAASLWPEFQHGAVAVKDARKGEKIILVSAAGKSSKTILLQSIHQQGLSPLLLPAKVVHLPQLPLLASGKLDFIQLEVVATQKKSKAVKSV